MNASTLKSIAFIILVDCIIGFVSCDFTYDDDYAEINKDNYGFDISEHRLVGAQQPKFNSIIRGYRGPSLPVVHNDLAITGDPCNVEKYHKCLHPLHVMKTDLALNEQKSHDEIDNLQKDFFDHLEANNCSKKEICYHIVNPLYCKEGKCECLEVEETKYKGVKEDKQLSYDPLTLKNYHHCRVQENYGCEPSNVKIVLRCDVGLYCSKGGLCLKSSSPPKQSFWGFASVLVFMRASLYKFEVIL